jgi:hypothetical protein
MKRFSLSIIFLISIGLMAFSVLNRTVTGTSTTIASTDDNYVILHTGAAATYTLGTVSDGFSCTVANHGTGVITFSSAITTANGQTITVLSNSAGSFVPGQIGNSITLVKIGGVWRSI